MQYEHLNVASLSLFKLKKSPLTLTLTLHCTFMENNYQHHSWLFF